MLNNTGQNRNICQLSIKFQLYKAPIKDEIHEFTKMVSATKIFAIKSTGWMVYFIRRH